MMHRFAEPDVSLSNDQMSCNIESHKVGNAGSDTVLQLEALSISIRVYNVGVTPLRLSDMTTRCTQLLNFTVDFIKHQNEWPASHTMQVDQGASVQEAAADSLLTVLECRPNIKIGLHIDVKPSVWAVELISLRF